MVIQETDEGELIVLRHGPRTMPILYTHLIPATFHGHARMNVQNALAAAAASWAAGAHLHDIRQGLRTFTTSFFQAPGRLNLLEVNGRKLIIDYCHNVDGMRRLAEFVNLTMADGASPAARRRRTRAADGAPAAPPERQGRAIGVIGVPGDRRDADQREYGALAASAFDSIYVREDVNLRGRKPGESAAHVLEGIEAARKAGARTSGARAVLEEHEASVAALDEAQPGDLVVVCADDAPGIYQLAMTHGRTGRGRAISDPGETAVPEG